MLYLGETIGKGEVKVDIALDPLEGTTITAQGGENALSVLAIGEEGSFLHAPDIYMKKIAYGYKYENLEINENWKIIKQIRKVITRALEIKRAEKLIGSSLEAHVDIYVDGKTLEKIKNYSLDEITITSSFSLHVLTDESKGFSLEDVSNVKIAVSKTKGQKCQRCWKYKDQLIRDEICERCNNAIS